MFPERTEAAGTLFENQNEKTAKAAHRFIIREKPKVFSLNNPIPYSVGWIWCAEEIRFGLSVGNTAVDTYIR